MNRRAVFLILAVSLALAAWLNISAATSAGQASGLPYHLGRGL